MQVGFQALLNQYSLKLAQPLLINSIIGSSRKNSHSNGLLTQIFPASYQPEDSFAGHFEFGLKYEEINLEFLAHLFSASGPKPIEDWCQATPYSQYARRAGFLYEWLTGKQLNVPDTTNGAYHAMLLDKKYLTSSEPVRNKRWRILNNLPGTPNFCPIVRLTDELNKALEFDLNHAMSSLNERFGADVLLRTASWMSFKESRASFLIESEEKLTDKIQRFAYAMSQYCGKLDGPLSAASLSKLQSIILGKQALGLGLRQSPIFVGQSTLYENIVHYIAPHFNDLESLLNGLIQFDARCTRANPIIRAAVMSFAFVFIHPMRDGNGRIHRFLINDTLIRDGVVPQGLILPISSSITALKSLRKDYDQALEAYSKPFMQRFAASYYMGEVHTYEDGAHSNFYFNEYAEALPTWRYPDLTAQVIFLAKVIQHTLAVEMPQETQQLISFQQAQQALKNIIDMPDSDAQRIIRSLKENEWQASGKLKKEYPLLADEQRVRQIVEALQQAFQD